MYYSIFNDVVDLPLFCNFRPKPAISSGALLAASLASSAIGAGASLAGAHMTSSQFNRTFDFNRESRDLAYENQWKMFNAANEYDTPSAQRERLEAAGINPYAMLNGGTAGNTAATSSPSPVTSPSAPSYGNILQGIESIPTAIGIALDNEGKQIDNMSKRDQNLAELELNRARIKNVHGSTSLIDAQIQRQLIDNKYAEERESLTNQGLSATNAEIQTRIEVNRLQKSLMEYDLANFKPKELERLNQEINNLVMSEKTGYQLAHVAYMNAKTLAGELGLKQDQWKVLGSAMLDETESRIRQNNASANYNDWQTKPERQYTDEEGYQPVGFGVGPFKVNVPFPYRRHSSHRSAHF